MTAIRRQVSTVLAVALGLFFVGVLSPFGAFGFGIVAIEGLVGLAALLLALVIGLLWLGREANPSPRGIDAAAGYGSHIEREFSHVS